MTDFVHVGRDGWLFLIGGSNEVLGLYQRTPAWWWRLRAWQRLIERRAARCEALGARFLQVIVPEKLTVMPDRCSRPLVDPGRSPGRRLALRMASSPHTAALLDLTGPLAAAAQEDIYHRTDSHWNYRGALIGYDAICAALGARPEGDLLDRPFQDIELTLDLGSKLTSPAAEAVRVYTTMRRARQSWVNEIIAAHREGRSRRAPTGGSHAVYRNEAADADPRRVLLFGDSCAHYDPFALTGMLAETFLEIQFVWSSRIDWRLIEQVRPDIVIGEIAERFLRRVPVDDYDHAAASRQRLAEMTAPDGRSG